MFKTIIATALSLSSCIANEYIADPNLNGVTPEQGKDLACYIVADDFVVYDLRPLEVLGEEDYDY